MAIIYNENNKTFIIDTKNSSYQMKVDKYGFLLHLYYGESVKQPMDYVLTYYDRGFSGNPYDVGADRTYSMDSLPQEYPCQGNGDFRSVCLVVQDENGTYSCDLRYRGHSISKGKYKIEGMPAVYAGEEAETLEIYMEDSVTKLEVILYYGVIPQLDIITRAEKIINHGKETVMIKKAQTVCLDFLSNGYELVHFYGRHAMERNCERIPITHSNIGIGSRRGTSSHEHNPFMIVTEKDTTEENGNCYGLSLLYSGNFKGEAETDQYNQTRILLGMQDELFSWNLSEEEVFFTPEVVLSYSNNGLGTLSRNYHKLYRNYLCRGKYKTSKRPVLINNWEATYFDFTGEKILSIAKKASELGVEMLVLDDGWFGKRDSDNSGLGDWEVNEEKLCGTLNNLVNQINEIGMKFGIWVEPEMVSEDSNLYRAHPDWAFKIPERNPIRARNQLVLDFSRKEVVDYIYAQICNVLDSANIEYIKWDMNRSITDVYSMMADKNGQSELLHRYVLGLYDFLERIVTRYPNILLEGCSGGGGRFDAGMLYYTPQIWCSDNTDAIDRIRIQYGTSFGYPISSIGAHVSACPNHQTGRSTSMNTRSVVAMAGSFGYELDLNKISEEEKQCVKKQITKFHEYWDIIHNGDYYRLTNPFEEERIGAWQFVSSNQEEAILNVVTLHSHGNQLVSYVKLKGLKKDYIYKESISGKTYSGSALMAAGIPIPCELGEYEAMQIHFVRSKEKE